jgi:hypothetical protein
MLPACIVRRASESSPQGLLLCRGNSTVEANTTWARTARALWAPAYLQTDVAAAMRLPGLSATGLTFLAETGQVGGTRYTNVLPGAGPFPKETFVEIAPVPPGSECVGNHPHAKVDTYFSAIDGKQGAGGIYYCDAAQVRGDDPVARDAPSGHTTDGGQG